jgi:hypothetical protein
MNREGCEPHGEDWSVDAQFGQRHSRAIEISLGLPAHIPRGSSNCARTFFPEALQKNNSLSTNGGGIVPAFPTCQSLTPL